MAAAATAAHLILGAGWALGDRQTPTFEGGSAGILWAMYGAPCFPVSASFHSSTFVPVRVRTRAVVGCVHGALLRAAWGLSHIESGTSLHLCLCALKRALVERLRLRACVCVRAFACVRACTCVRA